MYIIFVSFCLLQCRVLLNLRTSQPFEEVLEDLGQVLKINGAKKMYTGTGQEVSYVDILYISYTIITISPKRKMV